MKLEDTWKNIGAGDPGIDSQIIVQSMKSQKQDVLTKLQSKVGAKIAFMVIFIVMYTTLFFFIKDDFVRILMGIIVGVHALALVYFIYEFSKLKRLIPMDGNIRETLIEYKTKLKTVIRNEEVGGLFLYPLSITVGFFFSMSLKENWDVTAVFENTQLMIIWIVIAVLFTPIGHWMARKMNQKAFGSQLQRLEDLISEIDASLYSVNSAV